MKNQVQLCTYADRFGKGDIALLGKLLKQQFCGAFGGVHILPFFYPIDGADAGFDPIDHTQVDARLGNWQDIKQLSQSHDVMSDVIVNHISGGSLAFKDFSEKGQQSDYADLFLTFDKVFPKGATEQDLINLYRPRPGLPLTKIKCASGDEKLLWTTFTADQIDIDVHSDAGQAYLTGILNQLESAGVNMIRLDAAGYAVKKAGTRCFMIDETFDFIEAFSQQAAARNMEVLVEIHAHYLTQVAIAKKAAYVYDFALPPLVLHALIAKDSKPLQQWLDISPRNAITVLDTHDGIGIIDVARETGVGPGLLDDQQVDDLVEAIHSNSRDNSRKATGAAASNVDLYQVNCTFYDALGSDDQAYLLARLIQFFVPGVPQVYYVGLLAGENDMALLAETGVGRDINRHYYSTEEIDLAIQRPVVQRLLALINFRNQHVAFQQGQFYCNASAGDLLEMGWQSDDYRVSLCIDLQQRLFCVTTYDRGEEKQLTHWDDFSQWLHTS